MTRFFLYVLICVAAALLIPVATHAESPAVSRPYPGITAKQHALAQHAMHCFFAHQYERAESLSLQMHQLEVRDSALPLSALLRFSTRVWRILNSETGSLQEEAALMSELDPIRLDAVRVLHSGRFADSSKATRLFIEGGINGFNATLRIRSNPLGALASGLSAVKMLQAARALSPQMNDVYLGLGLFECALANEPGIVHIAIRLLNGMQVSLEHGLDCLRSCSHGALYTREGAELYLIQFLSPFKPAEAEEKKRVFSSLQKKYPADPFYAFVELDEQLTFHRASVFGSRDIRQTFPAMEQFDTTGFSGKRYTGLIRRQHAVIDPAHGDLPFFVLPKQDPFSFYPLFLEATRLRYIEDASGIASNRQSLRRSRVVRDSAIAMLKASDANPMLREYYLWHMQDGLP